MALITDKVTLNPKATGSLPSGTEGSLAYDSTVDAIVQYGTAWAVTATPALVSSIGGNISRYTTGGNDYVVHTFLNSGTLSLSATITADIFIVAGGGSGCGGTGGGGGGGAVIYGTGKTLTAGNHVAIVGAGGNANYGVTDYDNAGTVGLDSSFNQDGTLITAKGGGVGSPEAPNALGAAGSNSGGGIMERSPDMQAPVSHASFSGYTVYAGNAGGSGGSQWSITGGGGGAGGAGGNGSGAEGGTGGVGIRVGAIYDNVTNFFWAGGGGGAGSYSYKGGNGGQGGGGGGTASGQDPGDAQGNAESFNIGGSADRGPHGMGGNGGRNTGGGGGGGDDGSKGGNGGSGIVMVRYIE